MILLRNHSDAASTMIRKSKNRNLFHTPAANPGKQEAVIRCMLEGVPLPAIYAVEDNTGALMFFHNEYIMRAILDFTANKFAVDGKLFRDCGGRAMNTIEDTRVTLFVLDYKNRDLAPTLVNLIL